ncbi:hypothetical protein SAMN02745751_01551 [Dethiosulfatibacter aminovorans DSM 17477]|uniref:SGNH/GDSL hydrolase family protein n=1 Tax=Dethiosulfatibacter aminovorans DSM 17477 TaxID=1121476 RepID=A0A1M6FVA2_9FIRM|nr:hypothetical protein [Dethiosulfatibacter aminovorans]SHJ01572.1 hypothetical protein SAMN02745751_01551 [Dethiosulfatibacter aminovorans DSM 17477]
MKQYKKVILYFIFYMILVQMFLPEMVDSSIIYDYRIEYDLIKNKHENIRIALEQIGRAISEEEVDDYIVLVGDSVMYSSPGTRTQSIGYYMEKILQEDGRNIGVFNLSIPSNQIGDIYAILLLMDDYNISRDNVVIDILYQGFVGRNPYPAPVFWFADILEEKDLEAYNHCYDLEVMNDKISSVGEKRIVDELKKSIFNKMSIMKYKDIMKAGFVKKFNGIDQSLSSEGESWEEKDFLVGMLDEPTMYRIFSTKEFDMTEKNYQIYFLEKIMKLQEGKNTLFFMHPANKALLDKVKETPGYDDNLELVQEYFDSRDAEYYDMTGFIENNKYSDHLHLIPEGYRILAEELVEITFCWFN